MAKDDANQVKPADSDDKHELWDRLEALRTVMLTTQDAEGRMGSRPVTVLKIDEGRMWFFIPITGGIADEVKRDPEVHISVMDKDDDLFVSLRGEAQVRQGIFLVRVRSHLQDDRPRVKRLQNRQRRLPPPRRRTSPRRACLRRTCGRRTRATPRSAPQPSAA